ncbi:hypothetical protein [Paenibacillus polymyxa]|uniref:hypothetical protein n=1 Tax=Paenibacillus polymyxa TaxID=1406 RepID=UPI00111B7DAB|nr:hypothetical protein [Paenibacillus polymyxa]QDA30267.1 hypothetical protein FGY93_25485 [Paenibacillus polymyxa]
MITQPSYPMIGNSGSNLCKLCVYRYLGTFAYKIVPLNEKCPTIFEYELLGSIVISCPTQADNTSPLMSLGPDPSDIPANIKLRHDKLQSYDYAQRKKYADQVAAGNQPDDPIDDIPPLRSVPVSSLLGCEGKWVNLLVGNIFTLIPVIFRFDKLIQDGIYYYILGWMQLPDGSFRQFDTRNPYPASFIQVIWC